MSKFLWVPIGMLGTFVALAVDDPGRSIMFEPDTSLDYLTREPAAVPNQADKCDQLAKEVEQLKGKPQRRYAAEQRYQAECLRTPAPYIAE